MKHLKTIIGSSVLLWAGVASASTGGTHAIDVTRLSNDGATSYVGHLVGSDTLNEIMDELLADMILDGDLTGSGYTVYDGVGSSIGQRWAEGSPNLSAGDPQCTPGDGNGSPEGNPGCEEITPMSRMLNASICDDDLDNGSTATADNTAGTANLAGAANQAGNHNYQAEGLAVCMDGVVVLTDNASLGQYGDSNGAAGAGSGGSCGVYAAAPNTDNSGGAGNNYLDLGVGNLADSGEVVAVDPVNGGVPYVLGGGVLTGSNAWKDALRLVYTGCTNYSGSTLSGSGTCAGLNDRVARCGSTVRTALLADWHKLFEGEDCGAAGNACSQGLRQAYRRDDGSGTSGSFLELIGVAKDPPNLLNRDRVLSLVSGSLVATPLPNSLSFCDGGQVEGFIPTNFDGSGVPKFDLGDPIRKNCAAEDDLCAFDGKAPVVRSIRSTIADEGGSGPYPQFQCSKGLFARRSYITGTTLRVCPDGSAPNGLGCNFPYYDTPGTHVQNFDCLNASNSRPSTLGSIDGRSYNFTMHLTNGTLRKQAGSGSSTLPQVASWRQNMAQLITAPSALLGFAFGPSPALGDYVCVENDATRNIGCIVGHTTCTLGFAGREAAYNTTSNDHLLQEPVQVADKGPVDSDVLAGNYKLARKLWLNAIHGFEYIEEECLDRGGSANECADEVDIAMEFYNYDGDPNSTSNRIAPLCADLGFIPMPASGPGAGPQCVGAMHASATNGLCGAPATQSLSACLPN